MKVYSVFGLRVATDFDFVTSLPIAEDEPDLTLLDDPTLGGHDLGAWRHVYSSSFLDRDGRPLFELHLENERELLRFADCAEFVLEGPVIRFRAIGSGGMPEIERLFLSSVLAYWLELRDVLAIHASAIAAESGAVAFLAPAAGGKSSVAASFLFAGHPLVSDDILAIRLSAPRAVAAPAYPEIKLNPDAGELYLGQRFREHRRFHPRGDKRCVSLAECGLQFSSEFRPLCCLYVLERRSEAAAGVDVEIETLPRRDAVIELVRATYTPTLVEGVGLAASRLERIGRLVQQVPVRRLTYPSGFEHLPAVREAVLVDLAAGS